jgi:hypothetical protein
MKSESQIYAVYKGDQHLATGTVNECAEILGIKPETVYWYSFRCHEKRRKSNNFRVAYKLDDGARTGNKGELNEKVRCKSCGTPSEVKVKDDSDYVFVCLICQGKIDKYQKKKDNIQNSLVGEVVK